jgi:hypothetical protein
MEWCVFIFICFSSKDYMIFYSFDYCYYFLHSRHIHNCLFVFAVMFLHYKYTKKAMNLY